MKKILLIAVLACSLGTGSYAQNSSCCCAKKMVHHKVAHHKIAAAKVASNTSMSPENATKLNTETFQVEPCYTYRQHNIVVTECPGILYDQAGNMYYSGHKVYLGNYPRHSNDMNSGNTVLPASQNDEANFEGRPASGGDDLCFHGCK